LEELATIVCDHLLKCGIEAVLTGGAVVTIYTGSEYKSYDLDFVTHADTRKIKRAMEELGFTKEVGRYFKHPSTDFFVEFPAPPLAIGKKAIKVWEVKKSEIGTLNLLNPTQCVMDRLAAFYHWLDYESLKQALKVARNQEIDLEEIEAWSIAEGMHEKYMNFCEKLKKAT
jgi:hypothetical protein